MLLVVAVLLLLGWAAIRFGPEERLALPLLTRADRPVRFPPERRP